jgi:hypothetical protein
MKTAMSLASFLTKAYTGLPFFQRKPKSTFCKTCGLYKTASGNFLTSNAKSSLGPNQAYTKVCRFALSKNKPCINTETTKQIVKAYDWTIGPNGKTIDTSIEPYLDLAQRIKTYADTVQKLNRAFEASAPTKPTPDYHLETYLFWLTSGFLFVTVFLLLIRNIVLSNLSSLGLF